MFGEALQVEERARCGQHRSHVPTRCSEVTRQPHVRPEERQFLVATRDAEAGAQACFTFAVVRTIAAAHAERELVRTTDVLEGYADTAHRAVDIGQVLHVEPASLDAGSQTDEPLRIELHLLGRAQIQGSLAGAEVLRVRVLVDLPVQHPYPATGGFGIERLVLIQRHAALHPFVETQTAERRRREQRQERFRMQAIERAAYAHFGQRDQLVEQPLRRFAGARIHDACSSTAPLRDRCPSAQPRSAV